MNKAFSDHHRLADLLMDLQMAMQDCGVWECQQPTQEALQSKEPFCIDSMTFEQWLRFVMIERFKTLLATGRDLPKRCHISPMAEEALAHQAPAKVRHVVVCLNRIDQHLSGIL
ncbi:YqcC family protein [Marinomonas sp. M1K-6]|uniref:YqcC family protein n=1 Tax=Marinomonas profundi TaxID=2726122 RepID=A0A847R259_9GAMM|nr:YqcC family protein [Marinomonas profundi]NLQ17852.1 YqcC family protein [Marinomonas profundi]UDV03491.1 YqcC family protein [Marinomonas profundi]